MRPVLFEILGFPVPGYGFMLMTAFAACLVLSMATARRQGLDPKTVLDASTGIILCSLVGSRLPYLLADWQRLLADPSLLLHGEKLGASVLPGIAAGTAFTVAFCRWRGLRFAELADVIAPSLGLGLALARIGCTLAGCCYGSPSDVPWAVHLPRLPGLRHPAPLYEVPLDLAIAAALLWWLPQRRFVGEALPLFLCLYGVTRFSCEWFRGDSAHYGGLTVYQFVSLGMVAVGLAWTLLGRRVAAPPEKLPPTSRC